MADDEVEFGRLSALLGFDGNDYKNWLEFIALKTRHGLDFAAHIWPAAQHHANSGKVGKTLAYIRPKALEMRAESIGKASAPVVFEDCDPIQWMERLKSWEKLSKEWQPQWTGGPWPTKWGPIWSDPNTRVPPDVLEKFKTKMKGNGHATA